MVKPTRSPLSLSLFVPIPPSVQMADGTTLWIKTIYRLYGISLPKLMELGKIEDKELDLNSLSPIPSDFDPDNIPEKWLQPFIYDSKIFLAGGMPYGTLDHCSSNIYQLSYQDDDDDNSTRTKPVLMATAAAPSVIPPIPVTIDDEPTFVQIGAKVYLLANKTPVRWGERLREDFYVLDPALRDWKRLRLPTTDVERQRSSHHIFAFHGKLFTRYFAWLEGRFHLFCFDDQSEDWNELAEDKLDDPVLIGAVSVPLLRQDQMVALSWKEFPGGIVRLYATLFDCKDNNYTALCSQELEGLSMVTEQPSSKQPSSRFDDNFFSTAHVKLVDIGNGLVCALVTAMPDPYLGVLVFTLTLQEPDTTTTAAPPQTFLNVKTHVKRAFSLPEYCYDTDSYDSSYPAPDKLLYAFLAPSTLLRKYDGCYAYSKGTTSPPRKQQKLASGTYPS